MNEISNRNLFIIRVKENYSENYTKYLSISEEYNLTITSDWKFLSLSTIINEGNFIIDKRNLFFQLK